MKQTIDDLNPDYRHLTYAQAEYLYMTGAMSADQWELYCYLWRNSIYRYSDIAIAYQDSDSKTK